jgi:hypothetical protein
MVVTKAKPKVVAKPVAKPKVIARTANTSNNYIMIMQKKVAELEEKLVIAREGLQSIRLYAHSKKFSQDPYIHKGDIILRVDEVISDLR